MIGKDIGFSIIVPIYNVERYLDECIQSVLCQTYPNFELILVDDGSPDNSPAICDDYALKDSRIKVIHKQNGGLVSARKAGVNIAIGDYVVCLDGDDMLHKECLESAKEAIDGHNPDFVAFGYYLKYDDSERLCYLKYDEGYYDRNRLEKHIFSSMLSESDGVTHFPQNVWLRITKRELYKYYQNIVNNKISMGEDAACSFPLIANSNTCVILHKCLYYYRQISNSMTQLRKPLSWEGAILLSEHLTQNLPLDKYDLRMQLARFETHALFNCAVSQFYGSKSYSEVTSDFDSYFPLYEKHLIDSRFSSIIMSVIKYILVKRLYFILFLLAKNKVIIEKLYRQMNR